MAFGENCPEMDAMDELQSVTCKVVCIMGEILLYAGDGYLRLTTDQAEELAEHLVNAAECSRDWLDARKEEHGD